MLSQLFRIFQFSLQNRIKRPKKKRKQKWVLSDSSQCCVDIPPKGLITLTHPEIGSAMTIIRVVQVIISAGRHRE